MWLPLAISDLYRVIIGVTQGGDKMPPREEVLASWCLPNLATACENSAKEQADNGIIQGFAALKRRFTDGNGGTIGADN